MKIGVMAFAKKLGATFEAEFSGNRAIVTYGDDYDPSKYLLNCNFFSDGHECLIQAEEGEDKESLYLKCHWFGIDSHRHGSMLLRLTKEDCFVGEFTSCDPDEIETPDKAKAGVCKIFLIDHQLKKIVA